MMIIRRKSMNQGVLMRDITISTPFTTRETAGGKILNRSLAEITSITGNTLVLNQLANNSEEVHLAGASKVNVTTFTKAEFGEKLYIKLKIKKESVITFVDPGVSTTEELSLRVGDANNGLRIMLIDDVPVDAEYHTLSAIVTNNNSDNDTLVIKSTNLDEIYAKDAVIINLTRMYGSGNEPTLKEFEQAYPLDYYDQTDGRLLDFKGTTLVSKDSSENVLDTVSLDVTTLTGKLCEKIFPDGLKRAGNVYDEIKVENGQLYAIKRVGSVNLGSLATSYLTVSDVNFFQCTIPNADMLPSTPNITSSRYFPTNVPFGDVSNMYVKPHDTIGNYIYIRNDSYTTAASFKTAMSGVLLYYELATELRYLIDTTDPYIAKYKVDGWGTEEIVLDTNACSPSMTINYPDGSTENTRFTYRKTADGTKLNVNGDTFITNLKGETVAWNQLISNGDFSNGTTRWTVDSGATMDTSSGVCVVTSSSTLKGIQHTITLVASHKYFLKFSHKSNVANKTIHVYFGTTNLNYDVPITTSWGNYTKIYSNSSLTNTYLWIRNVSADVSMSIDNVVLIDLTRVYGVGNEPTTVAAFEADYLKWFGKPLTYEAYNAGSLKPVTMVGIKTGGFNLFDKDKASQNTRISSTGNVHTQSGYFCSDYIKVFPNTQYYLRNVCRIQQYTTCIFYDINKNFIGYTNISGTGTGSGTITTSSNTAYIRTNTGLLSFLDSTCVSLVNDGSRNGQYASSWSNTSMLNVTEIKGIAVNNGEPTGNLVTIFPDGMKSAGNIYDYIGKENGLWVAYKRVGSIDLGTLSWSVYGNYSYILRSKFSNAKQVPSITVVPNATISNEYSVNNLNSVILNQNLDRLFSIGNPYDGNSIIIHDSRYNSSTINEALDGVILNYELATPQKYILDNTMHWLYKIDQQGVEEILPQNTSVPTTSPAKLNIKYKTIKPTQLIKVSQTNTNLRSCRVLYGLPYSIRILPYDGFSLYEDPIIKMGGVDITSTAYDATSNMITIPSITGDVDIECYAMHTMPSDYVRIDGIKNPSNACLNTSHAVSPNNRLEIKYKVVKAASGYTHIAASKDPGMSTTNGSGWYVHTNGNIYGYHNTSSYDTGPAATTNIGNTLEYVTDYYKRKHTTTRFGVVTSVTLAQKLTTDYYSICLFSRNQGQAASQSAGQIIYYFRIYDYSTTSYVRYYVPCLNDSGVAGFWDAAQDTFVGSSNNTAFSPIINGKKYVKIITTNTNLPTSSWELVNEGEEYTKTIIPNEGYTFYEVKITMGGIDITSTAWDSTNNTINISSVTDDINIECYAMYSIPSDYIRVDGIKNPSNAYINTGYKTSYKNVIKVNFTKATGFVIATKASGSTTTIGTVIRVYADGTINYDQNASGMRSAGKGSDTGRNTWIFNHYGGKVYLNGTKVVTYSKGSNTDGNNMWLYQCPVAAGQVSSAGMIIHFFSIFDGTTKVYERYYIPCLNASGVAGFWDAARGVFQGSSNSTAFDAVAADGGDFRLINFEDSAVKNICVTNWGGHYKAGEMYTPEARAVTSLGNKFENNKDIVKFNEMQYFTGLTTLSRYVSSQYLEGGNYFGAFNRCSNLEEVTLPTISIQGDTRIAGLFLRCTSLKTIDMSPITVTSGANLYSICRGCTSLTSAILPSVTVSASYIHFMYAFDVCSNITTIDASNVIFTADNANNSASFAGCSKLTRIIGGLSGWKQTNNMSACPLTHDAAVELLESLGTVTSARTLKLKTSVYNSLTAEEKAIATDKGWTLSYG